MRVDVAARRRQLEGLLVVHRLADEQLQQLRPLEPPVAEQLRVERRDHDGVHVQHAAQALDLLAALVHEMARVRVRRRHRPDAVVMLLVRRARR